MKLEIVLVIVSSLCFMKEASATCEALTCLEDLTVSQETCSQLSEDIMNCNNMTTCAESETKSDEITTQMQKTCSTSDCTDVLAIGCLTKIIGYALSAGVKINLQTSEFSFTDEQLEEVCSQTSEKELKETSDCLSGIANRCRGVHDYSGVISEYNRISSKCVFNDPSNGASNIQFSKSALTISAVLVFWFVNH